MCGIFAYRGNLNATDLVYQGLKRLDYRGYDSWGIAIVDQRSKIKDQNEILIEKHVGKIGEAKLTLPDSHIAIGHTRWATTGAVTDSNAHPHFASDYSFALAQNGIVENYQELKEKLVKKGYSFISETDTEVIVRLIEEKRKTIKDLKKAVSSAFKELEGRNTIILLTKDKQIIAVRNGSPLVIGVNNNNEVFLSSDTLSFADHAQKMIIVNNGQMVYINGGIKLYDIQSRKEVSYEVSQIRFTTNTVDKAGYEHYMLKEIYEAPFVLTQVVRQNPRNYEELVKAIKQVKNVYTIGSGGAGLAAAQTAFYLRDIGKIKATSLTGANAVEYFELFTPQDLIIAISQSGETADVLEVLEAAQKKGVTIASYVNMPGSMMTRMSDYKLMSEAGPEICVMATKTMHSQIGFGYLLAKSVINQGSDGRRQLQSLGVTIGEYLKEQKNHEQLQKIAKMLATKHDIFLLGKYQNFHIIQEGMVKIIEAAYIHAHALPSGDLKHYVITLMEKGVMVIVAISNDKVKHDIMNAVDEVRLRGAKVIAISPESNKNFDYHIQVPDTGETSALVNLSVLQLLSYYMALELGNNIDKPRNIAKSVTVK